MKIKELNKRQHIEQNTKLSKVFNQFERLLIELRKKELPDEIVNTVNISIEHINTISKSNNDMRKEIKKAQSGIIKLLEKELKLVTKNYYRNTWIAIGMTVFGIPLGVAFGTSLGNMAFLGIGIPIGMVIGMAVGSGMDKKALEEGRQLDIEIHY